MGCDCCKEMDPKAYELCEEWRKGKKRRIAPCGGTEVGGSNPDELLLRGSNYTPPKKKRKKRKHVGGKR